MTLAAVKRSFGWGRRSWERRVASGCSRWTQTTTVGGMGSQGGDGARTLLCWDWIALRRRGELAGAEATASGNRGEKEEWRRRSRLIQQAKSGGERCAWHTTMTRTRQGQRWRLRACVEAGGSSPTARVCLLPLFQLITELPLVLNPKLLPNLCNN